MHDEVARNLGKESPSGDYENILFAGEQLQFSDDQVINFDAKNPFEFHSITAGRGSMCFILVFVRF